MDHFAASAGAEAEAAATAGQDSAAQQNTRCACQIAVPAGAVSSSLCGTCTHALELAVTGSLTQTALSVPRGARAVDVCWEGRQGSWARTAVAGRPQQCCCSPSWHLGTGVGASAAAVALLASEARAGWLLVPRLPCCLGVRHADIAEAVGVQRRIGVLQQDAILLSLPTAELYLRHTGCASVTGGRPCLLQALKLCAGQQA